MDTIKILLRDGRFWVAVVALLNAIVFYLDPAFPKEIWAGIDALVAVVVAIVCVPAARATAAQRKLEGK
jgi:hypothetical protein